jgi:aryl-alcohol dehydrogenase-like predicted oxidoreductase
MTLHNRLILGTVQFGIPYGVSNNYGKTNKSEVASILSYALNHNINMIDVAASYGEAEQILGHEMLGVTKKWKIITKTPHFKNESIGIKEVNQLISSFQRSRERLGQDVLYGLLIHACDDLFLPGGRRLLQAINNLKEQGVVNKIGVSLYDSTQIDRILNEFKVDLIQLPVNILDQRLFSSGHFKKLKDFNVEIHARSIFLQGLLLMPLNRIPRWFNPISGILKALHEEANRRDMNVLQLALGFVQSIDEIDHIIVGVNTLDQLMEIKSAESTQVNPYEFSKFSVSDPIFVNPSNWKI